ncbi:hypothetical protein CEXT_555191 [Caerostris extrusa]|uniref:Uncharacterized protein n=1 Tax=Caerostris extrusa TaxID=172846 RepID=A0AAV4Y2W1_CAEEX|nr:hypothetical protein CEXT_555191 [Caerostris extrusa]
MEILITFGLHHFTILRTFVMSCQCGSTRKRPVTKYLFLAGSHQQMFAVNTEDKQNTRIRLHALLRRDLPPPPLPSLTPVLGALTETHLLSDQKEPNHFPSHTPAQNDL